MSAAYRFRVRDGARIAARRGGMMALYIVFAVCARSERPEPDTTMITVEQSPGALASRRECQAALDAARAALIRKDADACITSLAEAAAFFRNQARTDAPEVRPVLSEAAEEMETLAANIVNGRARTPRDFDRAFARANAAEATQHLAHARAALAERDDVRAGEELIMVADHLERAAKDAKARNDRVVQTAIADARTIGSEMMRGTRAAPDETNKVTVEIERAIRRIVERVYVPPGPKPLTRDE
jgi:hypothetical protein